MYRVNADGIIEGVRYDDLSTTIDNDTVRPAKLTLADVDDRLTAEC